MMSFPARKPELPVLDVQGALDRIAGDETLLHEIAEIFLNDGPQLLSELQLAVASRDRLPTERHAHALKGIAANVGGLRVERAALAVEDAARSDQMELAAIAADSLAREFGRLANTLRDTVAGSGACAAD